jgi:hypothetical protein
MTCAGCNHDDPHGRRGHGSCSHVDLTDHGQAELMRLERELKGKDPIVRRAVLGCFVHIPGMTKRCECKRLRKTAKPPTYKRGREGAVTDDEARAIEAADAADGLPPLQPCDGSGKLGIEPWKIRPCPGCPACTGRPTGERGTP